MRRRQMDCCCCCAGEPRRDQWKMSGLRVERAMCNLHARIYVLAALTEIICDAIKSIKQTGGARNKCRACFFWWRVSSEAVCNNIIRVYPITTLCVLCDVLWPLGANVHLKEPHIFPPTTHREHTTLIRNNTAFMLVAFMVFSAPLLSVSLGAFPQNAYALCVSVDSAKNSTTTIRNQLNYS